MAGYSQTPLLHKLGIKPSAIIHVHGEPSNYFELLGPLPEKAIVKPALKGHLDFIHLFVTEKFAFEKLFIKAAELIVNDGMIWVSWPKKSAKLRSDIDENIVRDFGLKTGLVDVKVCAVDETWSGLKFVIRLKDRKKV